MVVYDVVQTEELITGGTISTAGRTGRPAYFYAKTNVALGGWFNASKSYMDCDATGSVTGLMSAHCMELRLPSTVQAGGHLTVGEFELVTQASTTVNSNVSWMWFQGSGDATALADLQDKASLFEMTGFSEGTGNIFSVGAGGAAVAATIRIKIDDVDYYIMLSAAEAN